MDKKAFVTEANLRDRKNPEGLQFSAGSVFFSPSGTICNSPFWAVMRGGHKRAFGSFASLRPKRFAAQQNSSRGLSYRPFGRSVPFSPERNRRVAKSKASKRKRWPKFPVSKLEARSRATFFERHASSLSLHAAPHPVSSGARAAEESSRAWLHVPLHVSIFTTRICDVVVEVLYWNDAHWCHIVFLRDVT